MIDPNAAVHPDAQIADDVQIGPFCMIGADVKIGSGSKIHSHVVIKGPTTIGRGNTIFQFSSVGEDCQDLKYGGEKTQLKIGDGNVIRENCTIHRGTVQGGGVTSIGNNNLLMAYVHIAHDCVISNDCILSNNAGLAGHVILGDSVIMGGFTAAHQFCQIGAYSMMRGGSALFMDLPAFVMASGNPAKAAGMNYEGMRRRGWSSKTINALKTSYKIIYKQGRLLSDAIKILEEMAEETPEISMLSNSLKQSRRGIIR